jgi:hypothetical protein
MRLEVEISATKGSANSQAELPRTDHQEPKDRKKQILHESPKIRIRMSPVPAASSGPATLFLFFVIFEFFVIFVFSLLQPPVLRWAQAGLDFSPIRQ